MNHCPACGTAHVELTPESSRLGLASRTSAAAVAFITAFSCNIFYTVRLGYTAAYVFQYSANFLSPCHGIS